MNYELPPSPKPPNKIPIPVGLISAFLLAGVIVAIALSCSYWNGDFRSRHPDEVPIVYAESHPDHERTFVIHCRVKLHCIRTDGLCFNMWEDNQFDIRRGYATPENEQELFELLSDGKVHQLTLRVKQGPLDAVYPPHLVILEVIEQ